MVLKHEITAPGHGTGASQLKSELLLFCDLCSSLYLLHKQISLHPSRGFL